MSDETKISVESENGTSRQWAKGLFYRQDGRKTILIPKRLLYVAGLGFTFLTVAVVIQGAPELENSNHKSVTSPILDSSQAETINEIPFLIPNTDLIHADTSPTATGNVSPPATHKNRFSGPQLVSRPRAGKIPPGSFLKATLLSGASNGPVRAEVTEELSFNGELLVERGSILIGAGQSGEDRLTIRFSQVVHPDGAFDTADGQACDSEDKVPGIRASVWGSKVGGQALKLAMGIGLNFAGGMTTALQDTHGEGGAIVTRPTLKNAMLSGAATAALDQGREIMSDARNKPSVIEIPAGTSIYVLFQGN